MCWLQEAGGLEGRKQRDVSISRFEGSQYPQHPAAAGGEESRVQRPVQTTAANSGRRTETGTDTWSHGGLTVPQNITHQTGEWVSDL